MNFLGKIPVFKEFEWFERFEWFGPSPIEPFNSGQVGGTLRAALQRHGRGFPRPAGGRAEELRALKEGRAWPNADFGGTGSDSGCVGMRPDASGF